MNLQFVPISFQPDNYPENIRYKMAYVLDTIHQLAITKYRDSDDGFVPLSSNCLIEVLGTGYYKPVLNMLEYEKLIEINRHYYEGKCRTYKAKTEKTKAIRCSDPDINNYYDKRQKIIKTLTLPNYKSVIDVFDRVTLAETPRDVLLELANKPPKNKKCKSPMGIDDKLNLILEMIEKISLKQWYYTICEYGRLHSIFTNIPSKLREYILIDGCKTNEIDIKTSQPTFLYLLYIYNTNNIISSSTSIMSSLNNFDMYGGFLNKSVSGLAETYKSLVEKSDLYTFLQKESGYTDISRGDFKYKKFFPMLYGETKYGGRVLEAMKKHFPEITAFMIEHKEKNGYAELSRWAQRAESSFIFNNVAPRLKHIPFITIHDSIIAKDTDMDEVERVIREEFKTIGINPQLHRKF